MKVKTLKEFINKLPDDFNININTSKHIPKEQLDKMTYPYPIERGSYEIEIGDIGYSEKQANLEINLDKPLF
jgi:hypothetical protein